MKDQEKETLWYNPITKIAAQTLPEITGFNDNDGCFEITVISNTRPESLAGYLHNDGKVYKDEWIKGSGCLLGQSMKQGKPVYFSPPPEEQKVKDGYVDWLNESIDLAKQDIENSTGDERDVRNGILISYKDCLRAYLEHTPKQKEAVKDSDIDNIMGRFYFNLEKTNPDGGDVQGCYDKYREELKELFSPKAPEKEGENNNTKN